MADDHALARAMADAGGGRLDDDTPEGVHAWLKALAMDLALCIWDRSVSVAERRAWAGNEAVNRLNRSIAFDVLCTIAPTRQLPAGRATEIRRAARAAVAEEVDRFIGAVLKGWAAKNLIENVGTKERIDRIVEPPPHRAHDGGT